MGGFAEELLKFRPSTTKPISNEAIGLDIDPNPAKGLLQYKELKTKVEPADSFFKGIAAIESANLANPYAAQNPNSSAVGKYQFLWSIWGDNIAKFASKPVTREDFLQNPKLQEDFARHYYHNILTKEADDLQKEFSDNLVERNLQDPDDIKSLLHFIGKKNVTQYLLTGDIPESIKENNVSVSKYLDTARKARLK